VRALDCEEAGRYFDPVGAWGTHSIFLEQCMYVKDGEKPELRIGNMFGFNITKSAHFRDISFTGIDNVAQGDGMCNLLLYPVTKCTVTGEPSGKIEDLML
jgi:hypothetical protein